MYFLAFIIPDSFCCTYLFRTLFAIVSENVSVEKCPTIIAACFMFIMTSNFTTIRSIGLCWLYGFVNHRITWIAAVRNAADTTVNVVRNATLIDTFGMMRCQRRVNVRLQNVRAHVKHLLLACVCSHRPTFGSGGQLVAKYRTNRHTSRHRRVHTPRYDTIWTTSSPNHSAINYPRELRRYRIEWSAWWNEWMYVCMHQHSNTWHAQRVGMFVHVASRLLLLSMHRRGMCWAFVACRAGSVAAMQRTCSRLQCNVMRCMICNSVWCVRCASFCVVALSPVGVRTGNENGRHIVGEIEAGDTCLFMILRNDYRDYNNIMIWFHVQERFFEFIF